MRNIDSLISTIDEEELKVDIEDRNQWIKVTNIIKIPNAPKILKIMVENSEMVKKASESGVLVYNQSIPPTSIEKEVFIHLIPCYKCYSYEHKTADCPSTNLTICSECSSTNHTFRDCRSTYKKCVNCDGEHRTFAARCPIRKELIKQRSKEARERSRSKSRNYQANNINYAQATKGPQKIDPVTITNREDYVKIVSSITYAQAIESILPGSFHINVQEMYRINGLPKVNFPNYVPPPNIEASGIDEELKKLKIAFEKARKAEEGTNPNENEEMETESRKRAFPSPTAAEETRPKSKARTETETETEVLEMEGAVGTSHSSSERTEETNEGSSTQTVQDPTTKRSSADRNDLKNVANIENEDQKRRAYQKHVKEMNFVFIKTKETILKRGDIHEVNALIKEGRAKYVFSNPNYREEDCRALWENNLVDIQFVEMKNVSKEFFQNVEYNGRYVKERRNSVGSNTSKRK